MLPSNLSNDTRTHVESFQSAGLLRKVSSYQVISRNNDSDGNAYRLIIAYLFDGSRVGYHTRNSDSNTLSIFRKSDINSLLQVHVLPAEYKRLLSCCTVSYSCN